MFYVLANVGFDNWLWAGQHHAITWANADLLSLTRKNKLWLNFTWNLHFYVEGSIVENVCKICTIESRSAIYTKGPQEPAEIDGRSCW